MINYGIYHNFISPFLYIYENDILYQCFWFTRKRLINKFIKPEYKFKKWEYLESQLNDYYNKKLKNFKIKIRPIPKDKFTGKIINLLMTIKFGQTYTYKELAEKYGNPKAVRAAGQACKKNPYPLIIPCHRVVSQKDFGGYSGYTKNTIELRIKKALLMHEIYD